MKQTELLSPAGNLQSVYRAVQNGADAVYFGGKTFGARAFAANLDYDEMKQAIDYAHLYGARVYVTVNTLVYEHEVNDVLRHAETIYRLGADALIMQDIGMMSQVRRRFPDIEIHASTQTHNHNDACLYFISEAGAVRAVLAREMGIDEIRGLTCGIKKEVFIHGALCVCYSGQCLMSALTKGRSGNRGECAQCCRMRYKLVCGGEYLRQSGEYLLSPRDLGLFEDIEQLIDAGVTSLKIEGRMKPPEYVAHVTNIYAKLMENYRNGEPMSVAGEDIKKLERLFNRGFTKGHLLSKRGEQLMGTERPNHRGVPVGRVVSVSRDRIRVKLSGRLSQGDGIKFEQSDTGFVCNRIFRDTRLIGYAEAGETVELDNKARAGAGEAVLITSDARLISGLLDAGDRRKVMISGRLTANAGEPLFLEVKDEEGHSVSVRGDIVQQSRTSPTSREDIEENISRLGGTPFEFAALRVDCGEGIFAAKSSLNALRREAVRQLAEKRTRIPERRVIEYAPDIAPRETRREAQQLHVLVRTTEQFDAVKDMPLGDIYTPDERLYFGNKDRYKNLRLRTDRLAKDTKPFSNERLLVTDHGGIYSYRENNDIALDYSVYALNSYALAYFAQYAGRIALSAELDIAQTEAMIKGYKNLTGQEPCLEALIYARHELMAMQHCVVSGRKDCGLCKSGAYSLEGLAGERFPIVTDGNCNNYILNCKIAEADVGRLYGLGVRHFRVELSNEDAAESRDIVLRFLQRINGVA
jgi:putative protease